MSATVNPTASSSGLRTLEDLNKSKANSSLGKDEFLNILVAQLANQDPLEPAKDTEFIAQLAQFSSLEQMQSLNSTSTSNQAYSLMGKYVYIDQITSAGPQSIYGRVDGVVKQDGIDNLIIGDKMYALDSVSGVLDSIDSMTDSDILQSAQLIGKTISAKFTDKEGVVQNIHGQVSAITIENGSINATVGEQKIPISSITEIAA